MRRGYGPLFFFFFFFFTRLGGLLLNIYDIDVIAISGMPLFSSDAGGHIDYCRGPSPMVWETVPEGKAGCVKSSRGRYEADGPGWEAAILETGSSLPFFFFPFRGEGGQGVWFGHEFFGHLCLPTVLFFLIMQSVGRTEQCRVKRERGRGGGSRASGSAIYGRCKPAQLESRPRK
jgi:hypothetical protein